MKKSFLANATYFLAVLVFLIFTLGPILWALNIALTPEGEITKASSQIIASHITFDNFKQLMDPTTSAYRLIIPAIINSVKMSAISVLLTVPISLMTAYAFYRYNFKGKKPVFLLITLTMVIPVFTTIIPIYAMFAQNDLLDHLFWIAIIYVSAFIPLNTWLIYNHFKDLPYEVVEAAMMDGAGEWRVFFETILPLSWPILITSLLVVFLTAWSQFQIPMILTTSQANKVITLVIQDFKGRYTASYGLIAASGLLAILPPAVLATTFRKFLISGLTGGATKG